MNNSTNAQNWIDLPQSSVWLKGDFSIWPMAARASMLNVWAGLASIARTSPTFDSAAAGARTTWAATRCSWRQHVQIAGEVKHQEGDEHQHAADEREEEELDRRILAPRPAPNADQKVHRQQHHFPKDVEEEEVQREEDAQHPRLQQQEEDAVALDVLGDVPTGPHRQHAEERGEDDQREADAVEPQAVFDVERGNPRPGDDVLHAARAEVEPGRTRVAPPRGKAIQTVRKNTSTVARKENCLIFASCRRGTKHSNSAASAGRKMTNVGT